MSAGISPSRHSEWCRSSQPSSCRRSRSARSRCRGSTRGRRDGAGWTRSSAGRHDREVDDLVALLDDPPTEVCQHLGHGRRRAESHPAAVRRNRVNGTDHGGPTSSSAWYLLIRRWPTASTARVKRRRAGAEEFDEESRPHLIADCDTIGSHASSANDRGRIVGLTQGRSRTRPAVVPRELLRAPGSPSWHRRHARRPRTSSSHSSGIAV